MWLVMDLALGRSRWGEGGREPEGDAVRGRPGDAVAGRFRGTSSPKRLALARTGPPRKAVMPPRRPFAALGVGRVLPTSSPPLRRARAPGEEAEAPRHRRRRLASASRVRPSFPLRFA